MILLSVLSVSGCSVSEEDGLQEVTEKVSPGTGGIAEKDSGKSEDQGEAWSDRRRYGYRE